MWWRWVALGLFILMLCAVGFFRMRMAFGQRGHAIGVGSVTSDGTWNLVLASGTRAGKYGEVYDEPERLLLSVLFMAPGASGRSPQSLHTGSRVAKFEVPFGAGDKRVDFDATWDKVADVVEIDGQRFDRTKGNLFVVVKPLGGPAQVWQLSDTPAGRPHPNVVLRQIKAELPEVDAVQAIKIQ